METVDLELEENAYPIYIGRGLLGDGPLIRKHVGGRKVLIVTNAVVAEHYLEKLEESLAGLKVNHVLLPDGEQHKNLHTLNEIITALLEKGHNRSSTIIALSGGVIGDMAGFAAAVYQRGISLIQVPTTLLAQVDSSVGGKTAVNHPLGKNMIGAFHQPRAVIIDTETLTSLPRRELTAGLAEVIKHSLISGEAFFSWLEVNIGRLLDLDADAMTYAIRRNCEIKASVVAADEKEQGLRAILNLGHSFGHAIEAAMSYGQWIHGEAVAVGLVMAADLSVRLKMLDRETAIRVKCLIESSGLPVVPPEVSPERLFDLMQRDKKASDQGLRLILLDSIGGAVIHGEVAREIILATLSAGSDLCKK